MVKIAHFLQWVLRIFLIVVGLLAIYQLLRKIFGGSWEIETLILTVVMANLSYTFYIGNKISEQQGWSQQFGERFGAFERRFETLERKVGSLETDFREHLQHSKK